jgi:ribose-phosphate pyrophosphokinase
MGDFIAFAGTANPPLAQGVARKLGVRLGACAVERFPDGELSVRLDEPVRGREVFILQPTSPPVNEHPVELLAFAHACRRSRGVAPAARERHRDEGHPFGGRGAWPAMFGDLS